MQVPGSGIVFMGVGHDPCVIMMLTDNMKDLYQYKSVLGLVYMNISITVLNQYPVFGDA